MFEFNIKIDYYYFGSIKNNCKNQCEYKNFT